MARLPMDKRRIQSEKIEGFLNEAMKNFLASLDRKQLRAILDRELTQRMKECEFQNSAQAGTEASAQTDTEKIPELRYRGLSKEELTSLLQKLFPSALQGALEDMLYTIPGSLPAVVLDFPLLRVSASVDAAASQLLLDKRGELAAALLGSAVLENSPSDGGPS
jgi:hypothetical protein